MVYFNLRLVTLSGTKSLPRLARPRREAADRA